MKKSRTERAPKAVDRLVDLPVVDGDVCVPNDAGRAEVNGWVGPHGREDGRPIPLREYSG